MRIYVCLTAGGGGGGGGGVEGERCWSHLSMVIKAGAVVTKLSPYARPLSAASILREQQTHYRKERERKRKKGSGKKEREREREGQGSEGVSKACG